MIAIFSTEADAVNYVNKIQNYLIQNRPDYHSAWGVPEQSKDLLSWRVKAPIEHDLDLWTVPFDDSAELATASGQSVVLPAVGMPCVKDKYYTYHGDTLKCIQSHTRTIYEPKDTPALFSYFRDNSPSLQWIVGEQVEVKWMRWYQNKQYEVIQAHQTQQTWNPVATLGTLWKLYVDPSTISAWQAGVGYIINQQVTYNGHTYKCRQAHTSQVGWEPPNVPALWLLVT